MLLNSSARAVLQLLQNTEERLNIQAINSRLADIPDKPQAIEQLLTHGLIWHAGKSRYATLKTLGLVTGNLRIHSDGSAVMFADGEDSIRVVLEKRNVTDALDKDTVIVRLLEQVHSGGYTGRVLSVIKRYRARLSGIARKQGGLWFLDPLDPKMPRKIKLDIASENVNAGDLIGCEINYGKNSISVTALASLGSVDSPRSLIDSICIDMDLPEQFSQKVNLEADAASISPVKHLSRKDLRDLYSLTIDPIDARDFDDAISIETLPDDGFRLGVHIADVSAFVPPGSEVNAEALKRGTSVYLPDRVIPMIPEILSNGACSLLPDQDRLTKTVLIDYDKNGKRKDFSVFSSKIRSRKRLNYTEALAILSGESSGDDELDKLFVLFSNLNEVLDVEREKRGAVDLGSSDHKTSFGDDGFPNGFIQGTDDVSHRMIENFMVEANSAVAEYCKWLELDVLYRVHGDPIPEAAEKLKRTLSIYGFKLPGFSSPKASSLTKAIKEAEDTPLYPIIKEAVLRSMQKAVYAASNEGHYGLALRNYMHFTSPIRRYPDLIVHQAITAYEHGSIPKRSENMEMLGEMCSNLERRAAAAERVSIELMALLYLSENIGKVFRGVIRDQTDFGLFIRLLDIPVEGLAHISAVKKFKFKAPLDSRPGAEIFVSIEKSDPLERRLSLLPCEKPGE